MARPLVLLLAEAGHKDSRMRRCVGRGHGIVGKVVGRIKNHFLVACHEPQTDGAMIAIFRHGRDFDLPDDAVLGGCGSAGEGHGPALIGGRQCLIRDVDGQPPHVILEEIREYLDLEIAGIDAVGARERADDERGLGRGQRHGAVLKYEHPAVGHGIGRRRCCLSQATTGSQEQQEQNCFMHAGER